MAASAAADAERSLCSSPCLLRYSGNAMDQPQPQHSYALSCNSDFIKVRRAIK